MFRLHRVSSDRHQKRVPHQTSSYTRFSVDQNDRNTIATLSSVTSDQQMDPIVLLSQGHTGVHQKTARNVAIRKGTSHNDFGIVESLPHDRSVGVGRRSNH